MLAKRLLEAMGYEGVEVHEDVGGSHTRYWATVSLSRSLDNDQDLRQIISGYKRHLNNKANGLITDWSVVYSGRRSFNLVGTISE